MSAPKPPRAPMPDYGWDTYDDAWQNGWQEGYVAALIDCGLREPGWTADDEMGRP